MRLVSLDLRAFKKHESLHLDFDKGLALLRGKSEAGKSSVLQALTYAFFGSRFLPLSLEDTVTYGRPVSDLRVELVFELGGVRYEIARSKQGAGLSYDGGLVSGQDAVTKFVEERFGAPAALAASLWFAPQTEIRGALAAGSKATTSLIEQLADFSQIDRIIELVQANLPTGPTKPMQERLSQAEQTLSSLTEPVPPPDASSEVTTLTGVLSDIEAQLAVARQEAKAHLDDVLDPLRKRHAAWEAQRAALQHRIDTQTQATLSLHTLRPPAYDAKGHKTALEGLAQAEKAAGQLAAWRKADRAHSALPAVKTVWEGDGASFLAFIEETEANAQQAGKDAGQSRTELALLEKDLLEGVCQVCGLDYDAMPTVGERNARVRERRALLQEQLGKLEAEVAELDQHRRAIRLINQQWQIYRDFVSKYEEFAHVGTDTVPPKVEMHPCAIAEPQLDALREEISQHEQAQRALARYEGERAGLEKQLTALQSEIAQMRQSLDQAREGLGNLNEVQGAYTGMQEGVADLEREHAEASDALREFKANHERALELHAERARTWKIANDAVLAARAQLDEAEFANTLLKKIRSARPAIIDRLWSALLAAVSHYFSQMRGSQSVVTRQSGSFLVDGHPVEGLSGSTLDILGLAVRVALLRTFLPACSFLVLDEPAAACDEEREAALLGTIAAAQFDSVLLVTHSDLADAYAAQLVVL